MVRYQAEDKARIKRQLVEQAVKLAMDNKWEEAAAKNRELIDLFSGDVDSYNRLGKALTELGKYVEARDYYRKALELDPMNRIAEKNLARLANVTANEGTDKASRQLDPRLFIEETGKTGLANLVQPGSKDVLSRMAAGNQVNLLTQGRTLVVQNAAGEYLGKVEPRLSQRLIDLMNGGNKYAAAVTALGDNQLTIIIRELERHPSQAGRASFKPGEGTGVRAYIKGNVLQYDFEDEDDEDDGVEEEERVGEEGEEESPPADIEIESDDSNN
ncbi:MAG: tetratricopeptide repeat protein [Chloroflexota bacterium]